MFNMLRKRHTTKERSILRSYTTLLGLCLVALAFCMFNPGTMKSTGYNIVKEIMPFWTWGLLYLSTGIMCVTGARIMNGTAKLARAGIAAAAALTGSWAISFVLAGFQGDLKGWTGPVMWAFITTVNWFVASHPSLDSYSLDGDEDDEF